MGGEDGEKVQDIEIEDPTELQDEEPEAPAVMGNPAEDTPEKAKRKLPSAPKAPDCGKKVSWPKVIILTIVFIITFFFFIWSLIEHGRFSPFYYPARCTSMWGQFPSYEIAQYDSSQDNSADWSVSPSAKLKMRIAAGTTDTADTVPHKGLLTGSAIPGWLQMNLDGTNTTRALWYNMATSAAVDAAAGYPVVVRCENPAESPFKLTSPASQVHNVWLDYDGALGGVVGAYQVGFIVSSGMTLDAKGGAADVTLFLKVDRTPWKVTMGILNTLAASTENRVVLYVHYYNYKVCATTEVFGQEHENCNTMKKDYWCGVLAKKDAAQALAIASITYCSETFAATKAHMTSAGFVAGSKVAGAAPTAEKQTLWTEGLTPDMDEIDAGESRVFGLIYFVMIFCGLCWVAALGMLVMTIVKG